MIAVKVKLGPPVVMDSSSSYGLRVKSSLEKLNVPAWYRDRERAQEQRRARHESGESTRSCRSLGGWRSGGGGRGWGGYTRNRDSDTVSQQTSRDNSRYRVPITYRLKVDDSEGH